MCLRHTDAEVRHQCGDQNGYDHDTDDGEQL